MIQGVDIVHRLYNPNGDGTEPTNSPVTTAFGIGKCSAIAPKNKNVNSVCIAADTK